jgi:hypothetical protein
MRRLARAARAALYGSFVDALLGGVSTIDD